MKNVIQKVTLGLSPALLTATLSAASSFAASSFAQVYPFSAKAVHLCRSWESEPRPGIAQSVPAAPSFAQVYPFSCEAVHLCRMNKYN